MFAVSVLFLNHAKVDTSSRDSITTFDDIMIPAELEAAKGRQAADLARQILDQVAVAGEIGFVRYVRSEGRVVIPVSKPGVETVVDVNTTTRAAVVSQRKTSVWESMAYLHKNPGPHNADLRGNWLWTQVWQWIADGTVYLLLFISATGVYLWFSLKADRRTGLIAFGAGAVSLLVLLYGLVT
jgi:hypothetical protein